MTNRGDDPQPRLHGPMRDDGGGMEPERLAQLTGVVDWYRRWGKRGIDLVLTIGSLPLTAPLIGVGWLLARLSTGERGFFTQQRVGRGGETFVILKLCTMRPADGGEAVADRVGVAAGATGRITPTGAWLRRTKLDELPQLWNVLQGHMSLVGPRPDVPEWLERMREYPAALEVRPGLTSLASVVYLDEEQLLAGDADPVRSYGDRVLPHKVRLNGLYALRVSPLLDLRIVGLTLLSVVSRRRAMARARRTISALDGKYDRIDPALGESP